LYLLDGEFGSSVRDEVSTTPVSGWINLLIDGRSFEIGPDTGIYIRPGETFAITSWSRFP